MPPIPSITTNGIDFSVGDTLSVTITVPKSGGTNGTLYIGQTQIPIQQSVSPYTYNHILDTSGNYNVYFVSELLAYSDTINISVTDSSSSSSVFLTTITKVKTALENVFVKKTDITDNLTSTDINKPLSANQGKVIKELLDNMTNAVDYYFDDTTEEIVFDYDLITDNLIVADNLTTNSSTQVLSAKQGKILNEKIGDAIDFINK